MQEESIGLKHIHRAPAFVNAVSVVQLDCTQVGEKQNIRGGFTGDGVGGYLLRVFQGRALAAHAHCYMKFLGCLGQVLID